MFISEQSSRVMGVRFRTSGGDWNFLGQSENDEG
jgi:hypothetical protein